MAQLKDLIVQGNSRFIGDIYGNKINSGPIEIASNITSENALIFNRPSGTYQYIQSLNPDNNISIVFGDTNDDAHTTYRLTNDAIFPRTTNAKTLGTSTYKWKNVYIGTANTYGSTTQSIYWNDGVPTITEYMFPRYYSDLDFTSTNPKPGVYRMQTTHPVTGVAEYGGIISMTETSVDSPNGYDAQLLISSPDGSDNMHAYIRRLKSTPKWTAWKKILTEDDVAAKTTSLTFGSTSTIATINGNDIKVTMPANPNTDTDVTQSLTTTSNWRKILLGYQNVSSQGAEVTTQTNQAYVTNLIEAQPSEGYLGAKGYYLYNANKAYGNYKIATLGTADTIGVAQIGAGNATAAGTAGNAHGILYLYSDTTKYSEIISTLDIKGNHYNYLPKYSTSTSSYYGKLVGIYKGTTAGSDGFSDVGSTSQPVYITANGVATPINYTIEKSVPSNAVFTDTNTKINVTLATTTKAYLLGVSTTPTSTAQALTAVSDTGVYLDTAAGSLTTTGTMTVGGGYFIIKPYSSTYDTTGTDAGISFYYNHNRSGYNADTLITAKSIQAANFYGALKGNADKATAANITTTANAVAYFTNTTGTFGSKASANGALYATAANGELKWGALPTAQGGTGNTSFTQYGVIYANPSTKLVSTGQGTSGYVLTAKGAAAPTWTAQSALSGIAAAKNTSLSFGETSTIATIGGNDINVTMPSSNFTHHYGSGVASTTYWITTNIVASNTGTTWIRGQAFGSKGMASPAFVVFTARFYKINGSNPLDGETSVTLNYWDPLGLYSSFQAAFDSNRKVYFSFKYNDRYSRVEALINHDIVTKNEIAGISTTAPTVAATYAGTKVTT